MKQLLEVPLNDNITYIGTQAFYDCENLKFEHLPQKIVEIGDYAFRGTGVTFSSVPNSLIKIGTQCFQNCSYVDIIDFNQIEEIGARCFQYAGAYSTIHDDKALYVHENMKKIGINAFDGYKNNSFEFIYTPYTIDIAEEKYGVITTIINKDSIARYAHLASEGV